MVVNRTKCPPIFSMIIRKIETSPSTRATRARTLLLIGHRRRRRCRVCTADTVFEQTCSPLTHSRRPHMHLVESILHTATLGTVIGLVIALPGTRHIAVYTKTVYRFGFVLVSSSSSVLSLTRSNPLPCQN